MELPLRSRSPWCVLLMLALFVSCAASIHAAGRQVPEGQSTEGFLQAVQGPIQCVKQTASIDCDLLPECVWCIGTKVGTGCYPERLAKILPKKYFECDKPLEQKPANADQCDQHKTEASCVAPECVWCTSAAVGASCYTPEQSKLLPKAIFKCKDAPGAQAQV